MKILFLTRLYYPHIGGVEKHIENISRILTHDTKEKHKVTILTTKYKDDLKEKENIDGVEIIRFPQPNIKYIGLLYTWFWMIKNIKIFKQSNIVHIHDVFIWYFPLRLLLFKKKVFTTVHGAWGNYPISFNDLFQKKLTRIFSEKIICIGDYISKYYKIKANEISYGAVEDPKINKIKKEEIILYVGRLERGLTLENLFLLFSKLRAQEVIFCGDGELRYECGKYGKVLGFCDPTPYYKKAKCVFCSGYLTILEALSYKCIVFATYTNPLNRDYYLLSPFKSFIETEKHAMSLYKRYEYIKNNYQLMKNRIEKGYNWATEQTWEKLTKTYLDIWSSK